MTRTYPTYVAVEWTDPNDGITRTGRVTRQLKTVADVAWAAHRPIERVKLSDKTLRFLTMEDVHAEGLAEDALHTPEVIHHVTYYGNVISCGATGPVRVEYEARKVTCEACKTADYQHLIDNAHAEALDDDAERTFQRLWKTFVARVRDYRKANFAGVVAGRIAIVAEDEAEAYREHYYRLMDEIGAAGKIFPPAARDMASVAAGQRYDDACRFIYSWRKPVAVDPDASMEAHYDAEMEARHPSWPTRAQLKPWESLDSTADRTIESMTPITSTTDAPLCMHCTGEHIQHMLAVGADCREFTPAQLRAAGMIGPYMWADENPYAAS